MKKIITEEMEMHEQWYEEAKDMTIEKLPEFIKKLTEEYTHDYGTICHAFTSVAIASMWAINKSSQGGITGFQAGCIMWEFIKHWNYTDNKLGMKLIDYDKLLYPQYAEYFNKQTISIDHWKRIQRQAQIEIQEANADYENYLKKLDKYKKDIAVFVTKHPDYYNNRKKYDPIGMGTYSEYQEEEEKKKIGFEFAPQKPYKPIYTDSPVYQHWVSIVQGTIPFGFKLEQ